MDGRKYKEKEGNYKDEHTNMVAKTVGRKMRKSSLQYLLSLLTFIIESHFLKFRPTPLLFAFK